MVEHTNVQSICDKNNETNEIQIPHAATRRPFPFEEFFFAFRTTVSVGRPHCRLLRCHHETCGFSSENAENTRSPVRNEAAAWPAVRTVLKTALCARLTWQNTEQKNMNGQN